MKNEKKGFTLIEILAVIIILGVLMLIAVPSVTEYISNSRKKSYLSTADQYMNATAFKVNNMDLPISDPNTTYYVPISYINMEKGGKSPYGDWKDAYVVVTFDGTRYFYYWTSLDEAGYGVLLTHRSSLDNNTINTSISNLDLTVGIGERSNIVIFDNDGSVLTTHSATSTIANGGSLNGGSSDVITDISCFQYGIYDEQTLIDWFDSVEEAENYYGIDASLILDKVYINGYSGYQSDGITRCPTTVIIPNQIEGNDVAGIDYNAFAAPTIDPKSNFRNRSIVTRISTNMSMPDYNPLGEIDYVKLPNSLIIIDDGAFAENQLTNITIPNTVEYIGDDAFVENQLTTVIIPNSVTKIGGCAFCNNQLTTVTIGNNVRIIDGPAFAGNQLTTVTIPNSVTSIGEFAFASNPLTSVTIGNGIVDIYDSAFNDCLDISTIYIDRPRSYVSTMPGYATNWGASNATLNCSDDVSYQVTSDTSQINIPLQQFAGVRVILESTVANKSVFSFKLNGVFIDGHSFIMPEENVQITEVTLVDSYTLESTHPYGNDFDYTWTQTISGATSIAAIFSASTRTEEDWDTIYIYDKDDNQIGVYDGTELSNQQIVVTGDTIKIRLTTDSSVTYWGFKCQVFKKN